MLFRSLYRCSEVASGELESWWRAVHSEQLEHVLAPGWLVLAHAHTVHSVLWKGAAVKQFCLTSDEQQGERISEKGFGILCYGTLAGGFLTDAWLNQPEPAEGTLTNRSLIKYKLIIDDFGGWALFQELLATLKRIGESHGVGLGEVALRWTLDREGVAGCIVGSTSTRHLARNLKVFDFALTDADRAALEAIRARRTGPEGDCYELENDAVGRHGRIMRRNQNSLEDKPWPG